MWTAELESPLARVEEPSPVFAIVPTYCCAVKLPEVMLGSKPASTPRTPTTNLTLGASCACVQVVAGRVILLKELAVSVLRGVDPGDTHTNDPRAASV